MTVRLLQFTPIYARVASQWNLSNWRKTREIDKLYRTTPELTQEPVVLN